MRVSPSPKSLTTSRQSTANAFALIVPFASLSYCGASPSENDRGLQHQNSPQTQNARDNHYKEDAAAGERHALPHQYDAARGQLMRKHLKEGRCHSRPKGEANPSDRHGLQKDHPDEPPVGHAYRLKGAELFQVLDREQIESLTGYDCAHDQG